MARGNKDIEFLLILLLKIPLQRSQGKNLKSCYKMKNTLDKSKENTVIMKVLKNAPKVFPPTVTPIHSATSSTPITNPKHSHRIEKAISSRFWKNMG